MDHDVGGTLVCSPRVAGWNNPLCRARWRELGFLHPPDFGRAEEQHDEMVLRLRECGCDAQFLPEAEGLTLDAVYAHDASLPSERGMICLRMGKAARSAEPSRHRSWYSAAGFPVLGEILAPGALEAGDVLWLARETVLVGRGYRTNDAGINQLRALLEPMGVQVIAVPLPHGAGPGACLHLMSLISLLDARTALVDLPWLAVQTVELLAKFAFKLIEIDYTERDSLACNVLSLGKGRLLAFAENPRTNLKLEQEGFDVRTFCGSEIGINGGGGPTCLTRPLRCGWHLDDVGELRGT